MGWDGIDTLCQKQSIRSESFLLLFYKRIPNLLSPIAEDLDWNGRRFLGGPFLYEGRLGKEEYLFN
jgi:hypothetical protein